MIKEYVLNWVDDARRVGVWGTRSSSMVCRMWGSWGVSAHQVSSPPSPQPTSRCICAQLFLKWGHSPRFSCCWCLCPSPTPPCTSILKNWEEKRHIYWHLLWAKCWEKCFQVTPLTEGPWQLCRIVIWSGGHTGSKWQNRHSNPGLPKPPSPTQWNLELHCSHSHRPH